MTLIRTLRSSLRTLAAALLVSLALVRPAAAYIDWTDIWWATPEVGWGVNFVQSDQFIFATFFVHGPNLQPDWYTGQMTLRRGDRRLVGRSVPDDRLVLRRAVQQRRTVDAAGRQRHVHADELVRAARSPTT